jgi:hypothetical protein
MDAYNRRITHPVLPEQWDEIKRDLGLGQPTLGGVGSAMPRRRKAGSEKISEAYAEQLKGMEYKYGLFCVFRWTYANATTLNETFAGNLIPNKHTRMKELDAGICSLNGVLPDGCPHLDQDGKLRYITVSPKAVRLTKDSIPFFPDEYQTKLNELLAYEEAKNSKGNPHILIWGNAAFQPSRSNYAPETMTPNDLERLEAILGERVPDYYSNTLTSVVVASKEREKLAQQLNHTLGSNSKLILLDAMQGLKPEDCIDILASSATVIWIDDDSIDLASFACAGCEKLFLLTERSKDRMHEYAKRRTISDSHCYPVELLNGLIKKGVLTQIVNNVRRAIRTAEATDVYRADQGVPKEQDAFRGVQKTWQLCKAMVEQVVNDPPIDAEIVEEILFKPFKARVAGLMKRSLSSGDDAQVEFLKVAAPLYAQAQEIYATDTDCFSSFWNHPLLKKNVKRLLPMTQTHRLCLYSSLDRFRGDVERLRELARHYDNPNDRNHDRIDLLIADLHSYQNAFGPLNEDVAYIHLKSGDWYRLSLNMDAFHARQVDEATAVGDPLRNRLVALGTSAKNSGKTYPFPPANKGWETFEYFRWDRDCLTDSEDLRQCIIKTFRQNRRLCVHRVLTFRNDGPPETMINPKEFKAIVSRVLRALRRSMDNFREEFGLTSINYGKRFVVRNQSPPVDRTLEGFGDPKGPAVARPDESIHLLSLHFDTDKDLKKFVGCEKMLKIKDEFYRDLLKARGFPNSSVEDMKNISAAMSLVGNRYLTVHDYYDHPELIELSETKDIVIEQAFARMG